MKTILLISEPLRRIQHLIIDDTLSSLRKFNGYEIMGNPVEMLPYTGD